MVNIRKLDLNLFIVLEALVRERSVTRAADRMGLSQPAVSAALTAAELACTGIEFPIPADEVLAAMAAIGDQIPLICRESGLGGMAATPTAAKMIGTNLLSTGGFQ